jgi:hypothetical protein
MHDGVTMQQCTVSKTSEYQQVVWLLNFVTLNQLQRSVSRAPIEVGGTGSNVRAVNTRCVQTVTLTVTVC